MQALKIAKIAISLLFINLYVIFTVFGSHIPYGTLIFGALSIITVVWDAKENRFSDFYPVRRELQALGLFIVFAVIGAFFFSYSKSTAYKAIIDFSEKILFCLSIYYICLKDRSLKFPLILFSGIGLVSSFFLLWMNGSSIERLELSENIGQNGLGNLMVISIFAVLYLLKDRKSTILQIAKVVLCVYFVYIIALTGSRKSLYAVALLIGLILITGLKKMDIGKGIPGRWVILCAVILMLMPLIIEMLYPVFVNSSMYERLYGEGVDHATQSDQFRIELYKKAFDEFLTNPIFGIGFKNYSFIHGSYTHSVYAEVLACTGLTGVITYFYIYLRTWKHLQNSHNKHGLSNRQNESLRYLRCFFYVFLFIGLGIGHLYDNISIMELGLFMAAGAIVRYAPVDIDVHNYELQE